QVTKERLLRANPGMRSALLRIRQNTSARDHFKSLIQAGQQTSGYSAEVRKWQREMKKLR
ncbi:MAG: hypothetical protein ACK4UN_19460, partial [Limisphaerales bacterium]